MEKTLDLKMPGVMELGKEELKSIDGGKGWGDLFWMFAENLIEGWGELSAEILEYHIANGGEDARIAIRIAH